MSRDYGRPGIFVVEDKNGGVPAPHAASHTDGNDDIQNATAAQKGVATAAQITKLDGIEALADVTANHPPQAHAASHTDGNDDIQDATNLQKGLATAAQITLLETVNVIDVFFLDACHFSPRTTNGAEAETEELATNDVMNTQFLFDPTTEEGIQLKFRIPDDWDGGTLKAKIGWDGSAGASPGDVVMWGVRARATANDEAMDQAFGAEVTITDTLLAVGDFHETAATAAITIGGSPAAGGMAWLQVVRKAADGSDTMDAEDAKFLCIALQYGKGTVIAAW